MHGLELDGDRQLTQLSFHCGSGSSVLEILLCLQIVGEVLPHKAAPYDTFISGTTVDTSCRTFEDGFY